MSLLPRAIASAALLLSGTALGLGGYFVFRDSDVGLIFLALATFALFTGLYGCCRVLGIKAYSGQADWPPADVASGAV